MGQVISAATKPTIQTAISRDPNVIISLSNKFNNASPTNALLRSPMPDYFDLEDDLSVTVGRLSSTSPTDWLLPAAWMSNKENSILGVHKRGITDTHVKKEGEEKKIDAEEDQITNDGETSAHRRIPSTDSLTFTDDEHDDDLFLDAQDIDVLQLGGSPMPSREFFARDDMTRLNVETSRQINVLKVLRSDESKFKRPLAPMHRRYRIDPRLVLPPADKHLSGYAVGYAFYHAYRDVISPNANGEGFVYKEIKHTERQVNCTQCSRTFCFCIKEGVTGIVQSEPKVGMKRKAKDITPHDEASPVHNTTLKCGIDQCIRTFKSDKLREEHIAWYHMKQCNDCRMYFSNMTKLQMHIAQAHMAPKIHCIECDCDFTREEYEHHRLDGLSCRTFHIPANYRYEYYDDEKEMNFKRPKKEAGLIAARPSVV